jgi:hypothetical protein
MLSYTLTDEPVNTVANALANALANDYPLRHSVDACNLVTEIDNWTNILTKENGLFIYYQNSILSGSMPLILSLISSKSWQGFANSRGGDFTFSSSLERGL